jgi:hypothetical protein
MDEADQLPAGDQRCLARHNRVEQRHVRLRRIGELGIVPPQRVVGQRSRGVALVIVGRCPLHGADPDVAGGHAREHRPLQYGLAIHRLAGRHNCQAAGGGNAERVHRLADDVFTQHRPQRGAAVAATGVARRPSPFELNIQALARRSDLLAEQHRTAIAERGEVAELVTGVRLSDRTAAFWQDIAPEDRRAL